MCKMLNTCKGNVQSKNSEMLNIQNIYCTVKSPQFGLVSPVSNVMVSRMKISVLAKNICFLAHVSPKTKLLNLLSNFAAMTCLFEPCF